MLSTLNSTTSVLHHLQELELEDHLETDSGIGSGDGDGSSTTGSRSGSSGSIETIGRLNSKASKSNPDLASSPGSSVLGNAKIPMDYNEKRTMTPPPRDARPEQRTISSSLAALDDDYMSDTSDISNLGMNSSTRGRARAGTVSSKASVTVGGGGATEEGSGSAEEREGINDNEGSTTESVSGSKEKKPEGVDFDLLQGKRFSFFFFSLVHPLVRNWFRRKLTLLLLILFNAM